MAGPNDELPAADLPLADAILVSHHHKNHCDATTMRRISGSATRVVAPRHCQAELGAGIEVVAPGDRLALGPVRVQVVPAYNTAAGSSIRKQHVRGECVGHVLSVDGLSLYHAGDTDLIPEIEMA